MSVRHREDFDEVHRDLELDKQEIYGNEIKSDMKNDGCSLMRFGGEWPVVNLAVHVFT